nr:MAG TPA: hypothetical protein [Caudoviricetes sp.]
MRVGKLIGLQCEIIKTQSQIIDELYAQLSMQLAPEDLGALPLDAMQKVADMNTKITEECL